MQSIVFQSVNLHVCLIIVCIIFQRLGGHPANWQHTLNEETRKRIRKREYDLGRINSELTARIQGVRISKKQLKLIVSGFFAYPACAFVFTTFAHVR